MLDVTDRQMQMVDGILNELVPERAVWAFGSRVSGKARAYSDLDLVILGEEALPMRTLNRLVEAFEDSELPYRVDVLGWWELSPEFRQVILNRYEVLREGTDRSG